GFDLSTQQIKALIVDGDLKPVLQEHVEFDVDTPQYKTKKGVYTNPTEDNVYAPVEMWIRAMDVLLTKMKRSSIDFAHIKSISGAAQQHGSVYWSYEAERLLSSLDPQNDLASQLCPTAFANQFSPNWQDHSTVKECVELEHKIGGAEKLAKLTGSKTHHRFTGPQIMRFINRYPDEYEQTSRISLVSSFLASIFLGSIAPFDVSDVCGMNMWDIPAGKWNEEILKIVSGGENEAITLKKKLGEVEPDGGKHLGHIADYYVKRFGFAKDCIVTPVTGDNPGTILALPLRPLDAIVSLGTSTTFLVSTPNYETSPAYHMFSHPTTAGLYMGMLCYCNGALARERIRDEINSKYSHKSPVSPSSWEKFDEFALRSPRTGAKADGDARKLGFYFPLPEIVPDVRAGIWRFSVDAETNVPEYLDASSNEWSVPEDDALTILESQGLSMRLRAGPMLYPSGQPRRVYVVGGGSKNAAICRSLGEVLGPTEGVFRLDMGGNACALGSAYKAYWSYARKVQPNGSYEAFEDFLACKWDESSMILKVDEGYREGVWENYGRLLEPFSRAESFLSQ
ncbi:uncharacterized protein V1510DRAFT_359048, partial [Dipodascopsis tothii]|uniref:uncharacterized protein n=1 Tax=Dipodascopsis tothii TaxID=44089 RepID=UPI0034CE9C1A